MTQIKIGRNFMLLALGVSVGLTSCKTPKDLIRPEMDASALYRSSASPEGEISVLEDTSTIADISWKEYFADTQLQALIDQGLANNYNLQVAYSRIKQAEAGLDMARGAYMPTVAITAQGSSTRISAGKEGTKVLGYNTSSSPVLQLGFSAAWEMDLWGKLNHQKRAKFASFMASHEYRNLIQTNLVASIAKSYYTLMALDEQLRITKETVELLKQSAQTMQLLKDAGQITGAAVEQSNALLYNTQLSIPALESSIRQQENAICVLLGRAPGPIVRSNIESQARTPRLETGIPAQMMARRPDVKQAEFSFRVAYELTKAAQSSLYPSFMLSTASLGYASGSLSDFFNPANIAGTIAAGITQPLLHKKQLKGNLAIAKAQQEEALLIFKSAVLVAGQEVSDILFAYQTALKKDVLRSKQIEALTKAVDFTQELLKAGEANYTEVLTAQQSLLAAQLSQVNDRLEQLSYSVSLYKALGGGCR